VSAANVERVREAYRLTRRGNPRELLDLVAPDAVWEGAEGTSWKPCETGDEVAKTLLWRAAVHRLRTSEVVDVGDRVIVSVRGRRMSRLGAPWWSWKIFQVVTVRDGRIARIQDFGRRDDAFGSVGLRT
jgi:ketosteroid isomerase-like protein